MTFTQLVRSLGAVGALLAGVVFAQPVAAASYDDCAVRVLAGQTYVFVSMDSPTAATDQVLRSTCSELVTSGYATAISTKTPMAAAGNELVCSYDVGPAHAHVWAAPDSFSGSIAMAICDQMPAESVTWWPLG
jgi:hypothetical protein